MLNLDQRNITSNIIDRYDIAEGEEALTIIENIVKGISVAKKKIKLGNKIRLVSI